MVKQAKKYSITRRSAGLHSIFFPRVINSQLPINLVLITTILGLD